MGIFDDEGTPKALREEYGKARQAIIRTVDNEDGTITFEWADSQGANLTGEILYHVIGQNEFGEGWGFLYCPLPGSLVLVSQDTQGNQFVEGYLVPLGIDSTGVWNKNVFFDASGLEKPEPGEFILKGSGQATIKLKDNIEVSMYSRFREDDPERNTFTFLIDDVKRTTTEDNKVRKIDLINRLEIKIDSESITLTKKPLDGEPLEIKVTEDNKIILKAKSISFEVEEDFYVSAKKVTLGTQSGAYYLIGVDGEADPAGIGDLKVIPGVTGG